MSPIEMCGGLDSCVNLSSGLRSLKVHVHRLLRHISKDRERLPMAQVAKDKPLLL